MADPAENKQSAAAAPEGPAKPKRRRRRKRPGMQELTDIALNCLLDMLTDETNKPSDRLNAIKAVLEHAEKLPESEKSEAQTLKVVFENIDPAFAE